MKVFLMDRQQLGYQERSRIQIQLTTTDGGDGNTMATTLPYGSRMNIRINPTGKTVATKIQSNST